MADFITSTTTKSAIRKIAEPLADVTAFENIVSGVIATNPFGCITYNAKGVNYPPVERTKQAYTARIVYQDTDAKSIGLVTIRTETITAFTAVANRVMADTEIAAALGGTAVRDLENESYSATLRCHDPNGELYHVNVSRDQVRLASYSDEAIRSKVETWADTVPELA
ncbi:MAG: hypothetical protein LUQ31_07615 [Methanoregula sp.]|nr:hypothetical protein [Methanoregula sp.]